MLYYNKHMQTKTKFVLLLIIYFSITHLSVSAQSDTDSLYTALKELPDSSRLTHLKALFDKKSKGIYANTAKGENENVLQDINGLKKISEDFNYPEGGELADQTLADYYYKNGLRKEALSLCQDVFKKMEVRNAPLARRIDLIRQIQNMNSETVDTATRLYYLDKLQGYIDECERKGITKLDENMSLSYVKYSYHRFHISVSYSLKDSQLMRFHLQEAEEMANQYQFAKEKTVLTSLKLNYYELSKQYEQAILLSNELLEKYRKQDRAQAVRILLSYQADIYKKTGQYAEAMKRLEEYIVLNDSIGRTKYYDELARLTAQHDDDEKALKIQALELESSRTWIWKMVMLLGILLISCGFLIYIVSSRQRNNKLLLSAKEKAEESDRLKSAFLANINHEIRTPLNAIIGFSEILIDEEKEDLRRQYVDVIRENNAILQQLIDGILSVSNIESGAVVFNNTRVELPVLMNDVSRVVTSRVPGDVTLNYIPGPEIEIETDPVYLGKVLVSLLNFAVYRTREGRVRYGYTLQKDTISLYVQCPDAVMTAEEQTIIFDYNRMLESWTEGVGLGVNLELGVAKNTIDCMGGTLSLEIEGGQGFTFLVTFPFLRH